jgi:ATP-binding cassette subfamily B protein
MSDTSAARRHKVKYAKKTHIDPTDLPVLEYSTFRRILSWLSAYWWRSTVVVVCMLIAAALNLAPPLLLKRIIDVAIPQRNLDQLWICCAAMIVGPLLAGTLQVGQKYGAEIIGQQVMLDLRVALYSHLQKMPFEFFTRQKPGEIVSHVLNDVQGVGGAITGTLVDLIENTVVLASTLVLAFLLDWRLAIVAVAFLPVFVAPTRRVGRARKALKRSAQMRVAELTGLVTETLSVSGILVLKLFNGGDTEIRRFRNKADELKQLALEQSLVGRWFRLLLGSFEAVGPAIVLALGGWLVVRGEIPLGTVVAFVATMKRLYSPASQLAGVHVDLMTSYAYFDRVFAVLDRTASAGDHPHARPLKSAVGAIEFTNVSFAYGDSPAAVTAIDLAIQPGMTVGIVGPSGAGKSTLASLLVRLYDPSEGVVTIDGMDLRRITEQSLRANIGVVTQEAFLFHTTVLENLRYGNPSASVAEIEEAATRALIHDHIAALPDGYQTTVGERGYCFSAGERQRIAIARALVRNPGILVLDEATSALDYVTERQIMDALIPLFDGRTRVIVAHRLSTVKRADLIVVMDEGRIVERGTHATLMARAGLYARLWRSQERSSSLRPFRPAEDLERAAVANA